MADVLRISHRHLIQVIRKGLMGVGAPPAVRAAEAEVMAEADLCGVPSHGVRMLPGLVSAIQKGNINPDPRISVVHERSAACLIDGHSGPGRFVSVHAMERAISLAKTNGVGVCVAKRLAHWGRGHAYARLAAKRGMIGICTTNAILTMVAWGSSNKLLGNNPLAIGVPRGSGKEPIVLDMAMSTASVGTIRTFLRDNRPIPPDWAVNADGQSSTDPAEVLNGGSVTPFGGHKGAALSVMLELLTGALSGGRLSFELANGDGNAVENQGSKLYFALDVAAFAGRRKFADRVNDFVAWLNRANRGGSIVLPGERSWKARAEHLRNGIPIHAETVAALAASGIRVE